MIVHYIWIVGEIPHKYKKNIDICYKLNPKHHYMIWLERDVDRMMKNEPSEIQELYFNPKNLINKYNTAKYTILKNYGGVYTDLDIEWKIPFNRIEQENGFPIYVDLVTTHSAYPEFMIKGQLMKVLDDPFMIAKQGIFQDCLEYRKERIGKERTDVTKPDSILPHEIEPIGPFLLTEWVYNKNIKASIINQKGYLDWSGHYGIHEQFGNWKED